MNLEFLLIEVKYMKKRIIQLMMCLLLAFVTSIPVVADDYMGKLSGINWDLELDKNITYQTYYNGIGIKKQKIKITNYSERDSLKPGYKEVFFTIYFDHRCKLTDNEIDKLAALRTANKNWASCRYYAIVDYNTGECLENDNNHYNVKVLSNGWYTVNIKYYTNSQNSKEWTCLTREAVRIGIRYPKSYNGLCIGAGGATKSFKEGLASDFFSGKIPFGKISGVRHSTRKVAHFMRIE